MAVCSTCNNRGTRIRTIFSEDGQRDECPHCAPKAFDGKFSSPSDKKIWMGYEAHPNEYVKAADGGYDRKPEYRAEQEQLLIQETDDERELRLQAEANKRATCRTTPMDAGELAAAMHKAEELVSWMKATPN